MGTRGRLKVPAHLAAVPDPSAEPEVVQDVAVHQAPEMPDAFSDDCELQKLWTEIVEPLDRTGFLSPGDGPVIEVLCRQIVIMRRAFEDVTLNGLMTETGASEYLVKHPLLMTMGQASDRIMEISKQLGMTWMTRARTQLQEKPTSGNGNPFSAAN